MFFCLLFFSSLFYPHFGSFVDTFSLFGYFFVGQIVYNIVRSLFRGKPVQHISYLVYLTIVRTFLPNEFLDEVWIGSIRLISIGWLESIHKDVKAVLTFDTVRMSGAL